MSKVKIDFTHKGWYLFCPIYLADPFTENPAIEPRYKLDWWFWINDKLFDFFLAPVYSLIKGEPCPWPYYVYGAPMEKVVSREWEI